MNLEDLTEQEHNTKPSSKIKTNNYKVVKKWSKTANAVSEGNWKLAEYLINKLDNQEKYKTLPGVEASEMTRIYKVLENLVTTKTSECVFLELGKDKKVHYNF